MRQLLDLPDRVLFQATALALWLVVVAIGFQALADETDQKELNPYDAVLRDLHSAGILNHLHHNQIVSVSVSESPQELIVTSATGKVTRVPSSRPQGIFFISKVGGTWRFEIKGEQKPFDLDRRKTLVSFITFFLGVENESINES